MEQILYQLNFYVDEYLSKYCKIMYCEIVEDKNKYLCVGNQKPGRVFSAGKSPAGVLDYLTFYLQYQSKKYFLHGGKKKSIENGKPCVQPPYKLPFDKEPSEKEEEQLNKEGRQYLGHFCKSNRCYYDYPKKTFLCRSSSIQPIMTLLIVNMCWVTSGWGLFNPTFYISLLISQVTSLSW